MNIEEITLNQRVYLRYEGRNLECRVRRIIKGPPLDAVRVTNGGAGEIICGPGCLRDADEADHQKQIAKNESAAIAKQGREARSVARLQPVLDAYNSGLTKRAAIVEKTGMKPATVTIHLAELRFRGLIKARQSETANPQG